MPTETLSREEIAKREVGRTEVSRPVATWVCVFFLLVLFGVPVAEHVAGILRPGNLGFYRAWRGTGRAMAKAWREGETLPGAVLGANAQLLRRINAYGDALDDENLLTRHTRGPVQEAMCRLGVGNEKAFVGRDGWLFYEPDIRYVTGPPFLHPRQLAKRARAGNEYVAAPQPDPMKAIVHFRDQLAARNITLLLVPVPVKPTVHPGALTARLAARAEPLQNASYAAFLERLAAAEIAVFDPAPMLVAARVQGDPQYLRTDTHWRPEAMRRVAAALAAFIGERMTLPTLTGVRYARVGGQCRGEGDIAKMLKLPRRIYPTEVVTVDRVDLAGAAGAPVGDVLLLGDSFSNIYSLRDMGWGERAGFAEQLSFELGRPVEAIIQNDAGAFRTRQMLAADMARGDDRLAGKKLLIWEFAARELAIGDWKRIELRLGEHTGGVQPAPKEGVRVTGVVDAVSDPPKKGVIYANFVMRLYVKGLKGEDGEPFGKGDGVVHVLGVRNYKTQPMASVRPGDRLTLRLRPWDDVKARYGTMKSSNLEDEMLELRKPLYWGEPE